MDTMKKMLILIFGLPIEPRDRGEAGEQSTQDVLACRDH